MAKLLPSLMADVICLDVRAARQITATDATAGRCRAPFNGRVVGIDFGCDKIGGTTVFTDIDAKVTAKTGAASARDLTSARAAIVDLSAIVNNGGVEGALSATPADLELVDGDVLTLDLLCTGGSSPTADGLWAKVYLARK